MAFSYALVLVLPLVAMLSFSSFPFYFCGDRREIPYAGIFLFTILNVFGYTPTYSLRPVAPLLPRLEPHR